MYRFWEAVQELKTLPQKEIHIKINEIWNEYLGADAGCPINVDSHTFEVTKKNLQKADRWCFDVAAVQVSHNFSIKLKRFIAKILKLIKSIGMLKNNNSNKRKVIRKCSLLLLNFRPTFIT